MRDIGAFISGCAGLVLTEEEKIFFAEAQPWGLILFGRNCSSPEQLKELTSEFRSLVGRKDAPVFIDQEGGRVQRMAPPSNHWRKYPSASQFGKLYATCPIHALRSARHVGRLMAEDLIAAGITVNCLPVLDLPQPGAHEIISDRAYGGSPEVTLALSRAHVAGFFDAGVLPVMKHVPGHGRASVDSHKELPVVTAERVMLEEYDFRPFAGFADCPMAMTAHVVYTAIDADNPATQSHKVIRDVIRNQIGFNGLLITDDLSMKALKGSFAEKTRKSLDAGCDVVLHCNGVLVEMQEVAASAGALKGKALARAKAALRWRRKAVAFDEKRALKDLNQVLSLA